MLPQGGGMKTHTWKKLTQTYILVWELNGHCIMWYGYTKEVWDHVYQQKFVMDKGLVVVTAEVKGQQVERDQIAVWGSMMVSSGSGMGDVP